jgi:transcriptional regulator with XRE-family HTH domain
MDNEMDNEMGNEMGNDISNDIEQLCAERLRELRRGRGLTLDQCEAMSGGAIKAVVLGSYERGNRAISLARLVQLGDFYEVPLEYFLAPATKARERQSRWSFDLRALRNSQSNIKEITAVKNFLNEIAARRQDWAGEFLTIRESDGDAMELLLAQDESSLFQRLKESRLLMVREG